MAVRISRERVGRGINTASSATRGWDTIRGEISNYERQVLRSIGWKPNDISQSVENIRWGWRTLHFLVSTLSEERIREHEIRTSVENTWWIQWMFYPVFLAREIGMHQVLDQLSEDRKLSTPLMRQSNTKDREWSENDENARWRQSTLYSGFLRPSKNMDRLYGIWWLETKF